MKKTIKTFITRHKKKIIVVSVAALCLGFWLSKPETKEDNKKGLFVTLSQVTQGTVARGITAQGKLIPEKQVDLNVYKQDARLLKKHVSSGDRVRKGDPLFTFDKKDLVDQVRSAQLALREAQLSLESTLLKSKQKNYSQEESDLRLQKIRNQIDDIDPSKKDALEKFNSTDLEFRFHNESDKDEMQQYRPEISGTYEGEKGVYKIRVYSSGARSGYSYELSGLEQGLFPVVLGSKERLGTKGLYVTFPERIARGEWVLSIPNVDAEEYEDNKKEYEDKIRELDEQKTSLELEYQKEKQSQKESQLSDNSDRRDITVQRARLQVEQARQSLVKARQSVADRTIRAPFSGTVHNMRNLVEGTKIRSGDDAIQFGTLLTKDFMIQFSLSIQDVSAIKNGDMVHFAIPAMSSVGSIPAQVQEVSVVPNENGRYQILARVQASDEVHKQLRSGLRVTIEVSRDRKEDVLRVPNNAVHYDGVQAYVEVMPQVGESLREQLQQAGSIRADNVQLLSEKRFVKVGLKGSYHTEILEGVKKDDYIVTLVTGAKKQGDKDQEQGMQQYGDMPADSYGQYSGGDYMY